MCTAYDHDLGNYFYIDKDFTGGFSTDRKFQSLRFLRPFWAICFWKKKDDYGQSSLLDLQLQW